MNQMIMMGEQGILILLFSTLRRKNTNNKIMILRMSTACSKKKKKEHAKNKKRYHYYITIHASNHNHCKTYFKQFQENVIVCVQPTMYGRRNGILWFANRKDYHNYVLPPNSPFLQSRKIKATDGEEIKYEYAIIAIIYRDHSSDGGSVNVMKKKTFERSWLRR